MKGKQAQSPGGPGWLFAILAAAWMAAITAAYLYTEASIFLRGLR